MWAVARGDPALPDSDRQGVAGNVAIDHLDLEIGAEMGEGSGQAAGRGVVAFAEAGREDQDAWIQANRFTVGGGREAKQIRWLRPGNSHQSLGFQLVQPAFVDLVDDFRQAGKIGQHLERQDIALVRQAAGLDHAAPQGQVGP